MCELDRCLEETRSTPLVCEADEEVMGKILDYIVQMRIIEPAEKIVRKDV